MIAEGVEASEAVTCREVYAAGVEAWPFCPETVREVFAEWCHGEALCNLNAKLQIWWRWRIGVGLAWAHWRWGVGVGPFARSNARFTGGLMHEFES